MQIDLRQYVNVTPSAAARRLFWHVLGTGRIRNLPTVLKEPVNKPGAVLVWVESGRATLELGEDRFTLQSGPRFWLYDFEKPRVFRREASGAVLVLRTLRFSGPDFPIWLDELKSSSPAFEFDSRTAQRIRVSATKVWRLATRQPRDWEWRAHLWDPLESTCRHASLSIL